VIEHVQDTRSFVLVCAGLASRAIFTTPNRTVVRGNTDVGPPFYDAHVREYAPGELLWVLRQYYRTVRLYHMPDVHVPWLEPLTVAGEGHPIIAECRDPLTQSGDPRAM
jgi:hypothetical protein